MTELNQSHSKYSEELGDLSHSLSESDKRSKRETGRRMFGAGTLAVAATLTPGIAMAEDQPDNSATDFSKLNSGITESYNVPVYSSPQVLFENDSLSILSPVSGMVEQISPESTEDPAVTPALTSEPTPTPTAEKPDRYYRINLSDRDNRFQPNGRDCVSTTVVNMLNDIAEKGHKGPGFDWKVNTSNSAIYEVRQFAREHDTMYGGVGSNEIGMRDALNYFGWGPYKDPEKRVYEVRRFKNKKKAIKAIAKAIFRTKRPAALITWHGKHVEEISGAVIYGQNPKESNDIRVKKLRVNDPWPGDYSRNRLKTRWQMMHNYTTGFTRYFETDGLMRDEYPEYPKQGKKPTWRYAYNKFVALIPQK